MADLYERYRFIVLRTIHQHISSHEDAEDILLDVFLAAFESDVFFTLLEQQQVAWRIASREIFLCLLQASPFLRLCTGLSSKAASSLTSSGAGEELGVR
jgi:hypothetical protein